MKRPLIRVLLVEDSEEDVLLAKEYLLESENYRFEVSWEPDPVQARIKMTNNKYEAFLIDQHLGNESGLDLIKFAQAKGVLGPCILLTAQGDLTVDLDASRYGAADYLVKTELSASLLERSIRYALSKTSVLRELDEKERKYRSLFERSIDPIFLANESLKLMEVNKSFLEHFNYSSEEALRTTIRQIFAEENDFEFWRSTLKKAEHIKDFEVALVNRLGERKMCLLNCVFIPDQVCCYQGIIYDLTMRKKSEKDMLLAERLSMTGKIARTIAHEVRNPLTNLTLALEQLRDEMPDNNEAVKLYGDIIERNTNRIEQLIGEMLNSSKPEVLSLELVSVTEIIDETIALAIDRINLDQIRLEKDLQCDHPRVQVDSAKIKIALLNIIINAIEAMQPGMGVLKIGVKLLNGFVMVSISDNGKGILQENVDKLFDPFYTSKHSGMGLGLTSTKNILNSHNATIDVVSRINEGTTFCIYFKLPENF